MNKVFQFLLLLIFSFIGCKNDSKNKNGIDKSELLSDNSFTKVSITDSASVEKSYNNYFFSLTDTIYAQTYPQLELDLLDYKAKVLKSGISKKGQAPGEFYDLISLSVSNGKLFLLECTNYFRCIVFDAKTLKYIETINFDNFETSLFPSPFLSSFTVEYNGDKYYLTFSASNSAYDTYSTDLYVRSFAVSQYIVNKKFKVIEHKKILPLKDFYDIKVSLKKNEKKWCDPVVNFVEYKNKIYLTTFFSDTIFVYNNNWKIENKIPIKHSGFNGFKTNFTTITETNKRLYTDNLLRFTNRSIHSIDIYDNKLFILYPRIVNETKVPKTMEDYYSFIPQPEIMIIDLVTNKQRVIVLPSNVSYFLGFKVLSKNKLLIPSNPMYQDDRYIYTVKYDF